VEVLIPLAILFGFFWFFVLLPQRRRTSSHQNMQDSMAIGDELITAGGLHGVVVGLEETVVQIEIAPGVAVRIDRRAIAAKVDPKDNEPLEEAAEAPLEDNAG
jgi:preprotein translocase subunit YajC